MTQIRIDTEHTKDVGRRLTAEGNRLAEIGHELQSAIGSLDTWAWDGRSRVRAEPMLSRVRPESARVAGGLNELGRKLVRVAEVFEQEDNTAARNLEGMPWVEFGVSATEVPFGLADNNDARMRELEDLEFKVDLFLESGATTFEEFADFMNSIGIVDEYVIEIFYYQDDAIEILSVSEEWTRWIVQIPKTSSLWDDFIGNLGLGSTANLGLGRTIIRGNLRTHCTI